MINNAQRRRQAKFLEAKLAGQPRAQMRLDAAEIEFEIFLACADDGNGGDVTNDGAPLPTFDQWINRESFYVDE